MITRCIAYNENFVLFFAETMLASTPHELKDLVHHYGGTAEGSFFELDESILRSDVTQAMFVDSIHDNDPGQIQAENLFRSVWDALPNTALVAIAGCAVGSCRGYDELVPHTVSSH